MAAYVTPIAGQQFRIKGESDLYLTCDPEWNVEDWNLWFLDTLYTVSSTQEYTLPYQNRDPEVLTINSRPEKQIFTLLNPDPNDPEIWAIEASDGRYLAIDARDAWNVTLNGSLDPAQSQLFFLHQGYGIYLFQFRGTSTYLASDHAIEGFYTGVYPDGWEYVARSFIYRDKTATHANAMWFFEKVGDDSSINDIKTAKNLTVSITDNSLKVNKENGTPIVIYSVTGSKILETTLQGTVNMAGLDAGVYIVATPAGERAKFVKR
jgi:hypothetical protein